MPLGVDDDDLEAAIGMYNFRAKHGTRTAHSLQRQSPETGSRLPLAIGPSHHRDVSCARGEEHAEKESQQLSPVQEEQPNSRFGSPVTIHTSSPRPKANARTPREGKGDTTYYSFQGGSDEIQPRKLIHSTSLPPIPSRQPYYSKPTLQRQHMPSQNIWRRQFGWADVFEQELRDLDVKPACIPKARSANKASHIRTLSDLSSTSSSLPQIQKGVSSFWKPKRDLYSHDSTSSASSTQDDIDSREPATRADVPPRHTEKRLTRFEWLFRKLPGGSDHVGIGPVEEAGQDDPGHGARDRKLRA
ncbi:uncharacterized protein PV07_05999 [Cladophialophora immunda]|uniref:Uncharacterized protein n=1 Tax=Cladophialophora immunda TaxID=569365 RepID=A0A0D1ZQE0_9EURO|nr:uncharacterized protein PV07_05999 [Cladophialophora immunda]KIW30241.1 hypothetical protein PV07_05999 [Cladophialophora immunda]